DLHAPADRLQPSDRRELLVADVGPQQVGGRRRQLPRIVALEVHLGADELRSVTRRWELDGPSLLLALTLPVTQAAAPPSDPEVRRVDVDRDESLGLHPGRDKTVAAQLGEAEPGGRLELYHPLEVRRRGRRAHALRDPARSTASSWRRCCASIPRSPRTLVHVPSEPSVHESMSSCMSTSRISSTRPPSDGPATAQAPRPARPRF